MNNPIPYLDGYDALRRMVNGARQNREAIADHLVELGLWPALKRSSLIARIDACLNPDKEQFFKLADIIAIMRFTGCYDPLYYVCDELGLERPQVLDTDSFLVRIASDMEASRAQLQATSELLERVLATRHVPPPPPAVSRSAILGHAARFHRDARKERAPA